MKGLRNIKKRNVVIFLVLVFSFVVVHIVQAVTAEPGTDANPLVTQDYVDSKVNDLTSKVTEMKISVDALNQQMASIQKTSVPKFMVIELEAGKEMLLGESTEMVLRGGKAVAISGEKGGLADLSSGNGAEYGKGQAVPLNHLLLSSRNDGRGIKTTAKAWILVKGDYTIK
ncbi:MAG: hypothetical protein N2484_10495 [Clostridia bacterium]|nr:hypothetical protein [Clostridia bacterium]